MRPSISTAHGPAAGPQPPHAISAFQRRKPPLCGVSFRRFCFISFLCKRISFRQAVKASPLGSERRAVGKGGNTIETRVL